MYLIIRRKTLDWSPSCGLVMLSVWPQWFVVEPTMTPKIGSLSASASSKRLRMTDPTASARQYPLAPSSKALQLPVRVAHVSYESALVNAATTQMYEKRTRGGQEVPAVQASKVVWVGENIGSTCYCSIAFSSPKIGTRGLHGSKARGTSCVHTNTWPRKTKEVTVYGFSKACLNMMDRKY